jgi:hypothetical protein
VNAYIITQSSANVCGKVTVANNIYNYKVA